MRAASSSSFAVLLGAAVLLLLLLPVALGFGTPHGGMGFGGAAMAPSASRRGGRLPGVASSRMVGSRQPRTQSVKGAGHGGEQQLQA